MEKIPGIHITAGDVCDYFNETDTPMGQATVYRQLESLVEEGLIRKYHIDPGSPACFEYVSTDSCVKNGTCFHCKCEKCGRLIHLKCDELEEVREHLDKEHRFHLDPVRTVFYGLCEQCAGEEET